MTFLIIGVMLLSSRSVIAADSNSADTLDVEKVATAAINNSQSVKTFNEKAALPGVPSSGNGNLIQAIVINPMVATNAANLLSTTKGVNTNSVRIDAYSKYIALMKADYAVTIQSQLKDNLEQDDKTAQLQLTNGLVSANSARVTEINYLKSVYQLKSLRNSLDSAYMDINLAMGEDLTKRYTKLNDSTTVPDKDIRPLDNYIKGALLNRAEIVTAQDALAETKKELNYGAYDSQTDYTNYTKKVQYNIDNSQNSIDETKITIQLEINNGYKTLQGDIRAMDSEQANYDLAESNYESAKVQYSNSMITLVQFEESEVAKTQAQINLKNDQLDTWLEQTKMTYACDIGPALK